MTETPPVTPEEPAVVRRLTRARDGRWFGGVCAGLGRYFDVSPTVYRLAFAALAFAGGTGILLYLAAWLVIPDEAAEESVAEHALHRYRDRPGMAVGVGLIGLVVVIGLTHAAFWPHPGNLWLAALIVGGALVWWELHGRRPLSVAAPASASGATAVAPTLVTGPRRPSLFGPVVGVMLATAGVLGLLAAFDGPLPDLRVPLAGAVVLIGVAVGVSSLSGRAIGGLLGLGVLLLATLVAVLSIDVPLRGGVGDKALTPSGTPHALYHQAIGSLRLDLTHASLPAGETHVRATLGIGELRVTVPRDVAVVASGEAHVGDVQLLGREENGFRAKRSVRDTGDGAAKTLVLDTEVGLGAIKVRRG